MSQLRLLLLSGGLDSAALAWALRPEHSLFVDYGQRPVVAERRAARAVADAVGTVHHELEAAHLGVLGRGLLASDDKPTDGPSPEWWPFRNQLLATLAASWLVKTFGPNTHQQVVMLGTVSGDGLRHVDGTVGFYKQLDALVSMQEGGIRVEAPAIGETTDELIMRTGVGDDVLGWTHSCHVSEVPCFDCPGCAKRVHVLTRLGRL